MLLNLREYHRPSSIDQALALLRRPWVRTAILAGGTDLNARDDDATEAVVDLRDALFPNWNFPSGVAEGSLTLSAMLTLQRLAEEHPLREQTGWMLSRAAFWSAPATIRRAATLGGSLASPRGGDDLPTALLALGAQLRLEGQHEGEWPLGEFLARRAELLSGSILTEAHIPWPAGDSFGLARVSRSPADRTIALAAAVQAHGTIRIALGGVAPFPRLLPDGIEPEEVGALIAGWEVIGDLRGSAEYRRWVAPVLVRRALEQLRGGEPQ